MNNSLFQDLARIIDQGKNQLVKQVSTITLVYWQVGKRINENVLNNQRAEYGKEIVSPVATQLEKQYGRGFAEKNLRRMMKFADTFSDIEIVATIELVALCRIIAH
jgi:hypothetical protein